MLALVSGLLCVMQPFGAMAQEYPVRPVRLIIPFPPGQAADVLTRVISEKVVPILGQQVVIDNRPGAGASIGSEMAARSKPDGYTLLAAGSSVLAVNPHLYKSLSYDALKDFSPVTNMWMNAFVLCVGAASPIKSVQELVAAAKAKPGGITYGSSGNGTTNHLATALLVNVAGISLTHVPYKGAVPSITDLMSGEIGVLIETIQAVRPQVIAGKIRMLGITSRERSPLIPDVPTIQEQGVKGYEVIGWNGIVAPVGTPDAILDKLNGAYVKSLGMGDVRKKLLELGGLPVGDTRENFDKFIKSEYVKWGEAVRLSGAKIE